LASRIPTTKKLKVDYFSSATNIFHSRMCIFTYLNISNFAEKGNVTVYEYRRGEAPLSVENIELSLKMDENQSEEDAIDFGEDLGVESESGDIDWGISTDDADQISPTEKVYDVTKSQRVFGFFQYKPRQKCLQPH